MIIGNNGTTIGSDKNNIYFNDGTMTKGSNAFGSANGTTLHDENRLWTNSGTVLKSGNNFTSAKGTYNWSSNGMLYGPNGKTWSGVNSAQDAQAIIAHEENS